MKDTVSRAPWAARKSRLWMVALLPVALAIAGWMVRFLAVAATRPDASLAGLADSLCQWDCRLYEQLALVGYDSFPLSRASAAGNWAFFPLLPLLAGALHRLSGLSVPLIGSLISTACSIGAAWLSWPLLRRNFRAYALLAAYLLCGPFSIYFTILYTEGLFVLLTVAVFAALRTRHFLLAGGLAALLSATRIVGVLIVVAMLVELWLDHRARGGRPSDFIPAVLAPDRLLALVIAPLGLFAYMAFLHLQVGDALAFAHVQRAWNRPLGNPLAFMWEALANLPRTGWWPTSSQLLAASAVAGYALSLVLLLKRRYGMALFSLVCITLPLCAGTMSMLRFVAALAPMPLVLAPLVAVSRVTTVLALVAMVAGGYFITLAWLQRSFVLV